MRRRFSIEGYSLAGHCTTLFFSVDAGFETEMQKTYSKLYMMPWLLVITLTSSILISYLFGVFFQDLPPVFPYISEVGGHAPQSILFGIALTVAALMQFPGCLVKYWFVESQNEEKNRWISFLNKVSLICLSLMSVSFIYVAVNPYGHVRRDQSWVIPVFVPHMLGASILFTSGFIYFFIQAILTWFIGPENKRNILGCARMSSTLLSCLGLLLFVAYCPFDSLNLLSPLIDRDIFYPKSTGWSAVGEWVMLLGFMCNALAMVPDLRMLRLSVSVKFDK